MRGFVIAILCAMLAGCITGPREDALPQTGLARTPGIEIDPRTGAHEIEISVLTYNVAGLPWPVQEGRGAALEEIGAHLGAMRAEGREPDIVLIQEGFIGSMARLVQLSGYPNFVRGPGPGDRTGSVESDLAEDFPRVRHRLRGEGWLKMVGSGLYVLSNFPIEDKALLAFHYCAGLDCLANKGAMLVRVRIPGLPQPVEILNTHLNSRGAAKVPKSRTLTAHNLQIDELDSFIERTRPLDHPLIFGGDFNTRNAPDRIAHALSKNRPYMIVRYYCTVVSSDCDIRMSFDGDAPWMDTQDLQGFDDGKDISIEPVRIEALFDATGTGGALSDHDGYLVHYRLRWKDGEAGEQPIGAD